MKPVQKNWKLTFRNIGNGGMDESESSSGLYKGSPGRRAQAGETEGAHRLPRILIGDYAGASPLTSPMTL